MREQLLMIERSVEERERLLLDVVVSMAKSLREERQRLLQRLAELDGQLHVLASNFEARPPQPVALTSAER